MLTRFTSRLIKQGINQGHTLKPYVGLINVRWQSTDYTPKCDGISAESKNQVLWLKLNRPQKFNAITYDMYLYMIDTFEKINQDKSIKAIVLTGTGDYYSSGNDLTNFTKALKDPQGPRAGMTEASNILERFVNSLINLEKLLISAVNGPAVGISVTTLPLFDYVIASDKATFTTPFTALGQCPEACSSVTFPQIAGPSKASELLLLNMTWDAKKAHNCGLVANVVEHDKLQVHVDELLYGKRGIVNACYPNSTLVSKSLIRNDRVKQSLMETNARECKAILELWVGKECHDALKNFFSKSSKAQ